MYKYAVQLLLLVIGHSYAGGNPYIQSHYDKAVGSQTKHEFEDNLWNEPWTHECLWRVTNDNDPKVTLAAQSSSPGATIGQTRIDPENQYKNAWLMTKAEGKGWHIHLPSDPHLVWTRSANWHSDYSPVTLQKLEPDNQNQYWARKSTGQLWAYDVQSTTADWTNKIIGFLDVAHCQNSDNSSTVMRRETNARQQIWMWETAGVCCPNETCPHKADRNLVEMKNWGFKDIGDILKVFPCENLDSARKYARYWIQNKNGTQTIGTWKGGKFIVRNVRKNLDDTEHKGPGMPVPSQGEVTFAEGVQIHFRDSNFFLFQSSFLNSDGVELNDAQLDEVVNHFVNTVTGRKDGCPENIPAHHVKDFIKAALQAVMKPIIEKELDKAFADPIKNGDVMSCEDIKHKLKKHVCNHSKGT